MTPLFKKLNFKDQSVIFMLNIPSDVLEEKTEMDKFTTIKTEITNDVTSIDFIIVFVTCLEEIQNSIQDIFPLLKGDAVLWYAYPKKSSKRYSCEFNRDNGWSALGAYNIEPVRQVSINEDWSALRFRKVAYIKSFTRNEAMVLSDEGKAKKLNN